MGIPWAFPCQRDSRRHSTAATATRLFQSPCESIRVARRVGKLAGKAVPEDVVDADALTTSFDKPLDDGWKATLVLHLDALAVDDPAENAP